MISGKSTTLKSAFWKTFHIPTDFIAHLTRFPTHVRPQGIHSCPICIVFFSPVLPQTFRAERVSWRAVVHLNVIRSIHFILDLITRAIEDKDDPSYTSVTPELEALHARLRNPVEQLYTHLIRRLTHTGSSEVEATLLPSANAGPVRNALKELAINSTIPWKAAFNRLLMKGDRSSTSSRSSRDPSEIWNDPNDHGFALQALAPDMIALWNSKDTQTILAEHRICMVVLPGLYALLFRLFHGADYTQLFGFSRAHHRKKVYADGRYAHSWWFFSVVHAFIP